MSEFGTLAICRFLTLYFCNALNLAPMLDIDHIVKVTKNMLRLNLRWKLK